MTSEALTPRTTPSTSKEPPIILASSGPSPIKVLDTMVSVERQVYLAIDSARKNPNSFITLLEVYKSQFIEENEENEDPKNINNNNHHPTPSRTGSWKNFFVNRSQDFSTPMNQEGAAAVDDAIEFLKTVDPTTLPPLTENAGLARAAKDLCDYLGKKGIVSDSDDRGADMSARAERHGEWLDAIGENIHYGDHASNIGTSIVLDWIIDDGVKARGHRLNVFSDQFNVVGIASAPHRKFGRVCVATFAGGFVPSALDPRSPSALRLIDNLDKERDFPAVKEMSYDDRNELREEADRVTVKEIQEKAAKKTTSPSPGVTQITRTFYTSSTPRRKTSTVNTDLAQRYALTGIPLADSKKRRFTVQTPEKTPVSGKQKIISTSVIHDGQEQLLDVSVEPVYKEDEQTYSRASKRTKREVAKEEPVDDGEDKGWFRKIFDIDLFGFGKK